MNVVELSLPTINKFASAYSLEKESILRFFAYNPYSPLTFEKRMNSIKNRSFRRVELAEHLTQFNMKYGADTKTLHNIEKLKNTQSMVVIGGQQAGLLTGPMYTISKIISIIKLAEEQEQLLGVPVLPVFWIAGEDHDYQEINHVFVQKNNDIEKISLYSKNAGKKMISELEWEKAEVQAWIHKVLSSFGETGFTKDLKASIERAVERSSSFVDFFSELITKLFKGTGLILVNASHPDLRKLETPFFQSILTQHQQITSGVRKSQEQLKALKYSPMLDVNETSMNLFYHLNGERVLLHWDEKQQRAVTKVDQHYFTMDELRKLLEEHPELFSNNVVTRPLMEEYLFPTLAFIGGPGEVSYWAELKEAFEAVNLEMPPVVPRISFTLLERNINSILNELEEDLLEALASGLEGKRKAWLHQQELNKMEEQLKHFYKQYQQIHEEFKDVGNKIMPHLQPNFEKNWLYIDKQFSYLKHLLERSAYERHEHIMKKYQRVQMALRPGDMPQERVWNMYYFLNFYGEELVKRLCELPLAHNGKHKVIFL